jgi:hypothetical protein
LPFFDGKRNGCAIRKGIIKNGKKTKKKDRTLPTEKG